MVNVRGWIPFGCNIVLEKIPAHARIPVVQEGEARPKKAVREDYERLRPLERLNVRKRGWTLDVLQVVQSLKKTDFSLQDVYAHTSAKSFCRRLCCSIKNLSTSNGFPLGSR